MKGCHCRSVGRLTTASVEDLERACVVVVRFDLASGPTSRRLRRHASNERARQGLLSDADADLGRRDDEKLQPRAGSSAAATTLSPKRRFRVSAPYRWGP